HHLKYRAADRGPPGGVKRQRLRRSSPITLTHHGLLMHPMVNIAVKAARRAGNIINRATRNLDIVAFREKAANDFVTEVDREAESAIIRTLREAYPGHSILAEESGASGESEHQWIVDPLDGTTNFLHGFPQYAVSIAYRHRGTVTH